LQSNSVYTKHTKVDEEDEEEQLLSLPFVFFVFFVVPSLAFRAAGITRQAAP
jgi:hypothetical protein